MTNLFICQPEGCNYKLQDRALNKALIKRARINLNLCNYMTLSALFSNLRKKYQSEKENE